jgi:hypothetical protein
MTLSQRIHRLEHTPGQLHYTCTKSAELARPRHQPEPHCPTCGGERRIYELPHHPREAEPPIRPTLPIIEKAYSNNDRADLAKLTDSELHQLKTALQALEPTGKH